MCFAIDNERNSTILTVASKAIIIEHVTRVAFTTEIGGDAGMILHQYEN